MLANGNGRITLTYSAVSTFRACPRRYMWRYVRQIDLVRKPDALSLGSAVHSLLESFYRREPNPPVSGLTEKSQAILEGVDQAYPALFAADFEDFEVVGLELGLEGPIVNPDTGKPSRRFWFGGKTDGLFRLRREFSGFKPGSLLLLTLQLIHDGNGHLRYSENIRNYLLVTPIPDRFAHDHWNEPHISKRHF